MESGLYVVVMSVLILWTAFWVIRLAVRHGVNDALRSNRAWLMQREEDRP